MGFIKASLNVLFKLNVLAGVSVKPRGCSKTIIFTGVVSVEFMFCRRKLTLALFKGKEPKILVRNLFEMI